MKKNWTKAYTSRTAKLKVKYNYTPWEIPAAFEEGDKCANYNLYDRALCCDTLSAGNTTLHKYFVCYVLATVHRQHEIIHMKHLNVNQSVLSVRVNNTSAFTMKGHANVGRRDYQPGKRGGIPRAGSCWSQGDTLPGSVIWNVNEIETVFLINAND